MPHPVDTATENVPAMAGGARKYTVKALKRTLKSHGLKTSGRKSTLRARAKRAHLLSKV
jgi:hypothetical protein